MNKVGSDVMNRPPRSKGDPIISQKSWRTIILYASSLTIGTIGVFVWSLYFLKTSDALANNVAFYTLILAQLWHVFNLPGRQQSILKNAVTKNPYVWMALAGSLLLVLIAYWTPPLRAALNLHPMNWALAGWVFLFSWIPVLIVQVAKRWLKIR